MSFDWYYRGVIADFRLLVNHETFGHVGFGAGLNVQGLSLETDDEQLGTRGRFPNAAFRDTYPIGSRP